MNLVNVARSIARGPPPEWLMPCLQLFRNDLSIKSNLPPDYVRYHFRGRLERMLQAIEVLEKDLPIFLALPFGFRNKSAEIIYGSLPGFKSDLEAAIRGTRQLGRKRNMDEGVCVAVIWECWKGIHGEVQPRSDAFKQACDDYWQACGHDSKGDVKNWRRVINRASASDYNWVSLILSAVQNAE